MESPSCFVLYFIISIYKNQNQKIDNYSTILESKFKIKYFTVTVYLRLILGDYFVPSLFNDSCHSNRSETSMLSVSLNNQFRLSKIYDSMVCYVLYFVLMKWLYLIISIK